MPLFGKHTVTEARDLLKVADYRFKETYSALAAIPENQRPQDLITDANALATRWNDDKKKFAASLTQDAIAGALTGRPPDFVIAEDTYQKILGYVQFQENVKGSLQDITKRIEKLSGKQILYQNQPKQDSYDYDLELFKDLDASIKAGEGAASDLGKKVAKTADNKWPWIVGGTAIGSVLLYNYLRK